MKQPDHNAGIVLLAATVEGRDALEKGEIDAFTADRVILIGQALTAAGQNNFAILPNLYRTKQIELIYDKWSGRFSPKMPRLFQALIQISAISV